MTFDSIAALTAFVGAYVLFVVLPTRRSLVACGGAVLVVLAGAVPLRDLPGAINWNVMGIFVGMLAMADVFIDSRCPAYLAERIVNRAPTTAWAMLFICALTGILSAFVENVATVLIIAPIALAMARRLDINPVGMMIGIAISSNLQGTATLIGDPPSMLLGGFAKLNFMDFFFRHGRPSIFFAVELGALTSFGVLYLVFRKHSENMNVVAEEQVRSWVPTGALVLLIVALALSSLFDKDFSYAAGVLCMVFGAALLVWAKAFMGTSVVQSIRRLDWDTTFFLMGIFVMVESLTLTGWTDRASAWLAGMVGDNLFVAYTLMVFISVVVSAFVDNVPFLAAMLPVAVSVGRHMGIDPTVLLFGLLIGASLGGNITPIGASANIVGMGMLRKEGYTVTFREWAAIAVPFTLAAVVPAYLFIWLVWS